ncbi:sodium/potassium-transporting ATPase subunit beta-1-like [Ptychodera flava]|uniref:sodium/potassium-transporting ATPase subunit beta-1-like n=1 Tax=Ptychodera flava TaxID=63121 RepID=UPI00396A8354
MKSALVFLMPVVIFGAVSGSEKFWLKKEERQGEDVCEEFKDYCTVRNECAYTFLFPNKQNSCPEIGQAVTHMQVMSDSQAVLEERIEQLLDTNTRLLERLEELEERFEARGGRFRRQMRRGREETLQNIKKLHRKHRWQAKKIKKGKDELERVKKVLNITLPIEPKQPIGLTVHPTPNAEGYIHFNPKHEESHTEYIHHIDNLLNTYLEDGNEISPYDICPPGPCPDEEEGRLCRYPINKLGEHCSTPGYGYQEGKPCIYVALDKIDGWKPETFTPENIPDEIKDIYNPNFVPITCHAKTNEEEIDMGKVVYHPPQGLGVEYFPYTEDIQDIDTPFQAPLVALQFPTLSENVPIKIMCKAWAANINPKKGEGKVQFTLHIHDGEWSMSDL